jgi:hypothetical protein
MVEVGTAEGRASVRGLQRCASVHACPWCMPKIRYGRATEVNEAGTAHLAQGGGLLFVTLTMPHDRTDRLTPLLDAINGAWKAVLDSDVWREWSKRFGIRLGKRDRLGVIRALEVNHGAANGWHPHLHNLVFTDRPMHPTYRRLFQRQVLAVWADAIESAGFRRPTRRHGVDVQPVRSVGELATYLVGLDGTRVDLELARGDLKRGRGASRSAFGILEDVARWGDHADLALWWEYEAATHGRNALTWSHGLKARYGIGKVTDQELAEQEVGHRTVLTVSSWNWLAVCRAKQVSALLSAVERGDQALVIAVLDRAGAVLSQVWWGPPPGVEPPG